MRMVYVANAKLPSREANGIQIMETCAALRRQGVDLTLLATSVRGRPGEVFDFYGVRDRFEIRATPLPRMKGGVFVAAWKQALMALGARADVVYGRFLQAAHAAAELRRHTVFEAHSYPVHANRTTKLALHRLLHSPSLGRLTTISAALRDTFIQHGAPPEKIAVVHDAAGDPVVAAPADLGEPRSALQVGYVGQLYPGKGMEMVEALSRSLIDEPFVFHVVGGRAEDIELWRERSRGRPNLRFHGFVPPHRTPAYRAAFDVLLAPYARRVRGVGRGDLSTWMSPLKLFEYMASAKPILCTDLPVLKEVLESERTALLLPPGDVEAWARALRSLREEPARRAELGAQARTRFLENHTWDRRAERIIGLVER